MSGFASLLSQFKQTTEEARAPPSHPSNLAVAKTSAKPAIKFKPPITPVNRIFIACPPIETGGPEALHQLCHLINSGGYQYKPGISENEAITVDEFGREIKKGGENGGNFRKVNAYMLYLRERHGSMVIAEEANRPSKYSRYNAPAAVDFPCEEGCSIGTDGYCSDLVVWPEIWTKHIDALQPTIDCLRSNRDHNTSKICKYQIAIWWLSVDNNRGAFGPNDFHQRCDVLHLVQSYYARQYVISNISSRKGQFHETEWAKVLDLTEFIPYALAAATQADIPKDGESETTPKRPLRDLDVVYNPLKGMHYTDEIMRRSRNKKARISSDDDYATANAAVKFHPIGGGDGGKERLSGEEVISLLKRAKVYIDFGHHPGMDRLPREAALAGCIVLTNREGAANFDKDVPIPSEFKFKSFDADKIYCTLRDVCSDSSKFDKCSKSMERYRQWISGQEYRMRVCIDNLVEEVVTKRCDKL